MLNTRRTKLESETSGQHEDSAGFHPRWPKWISRLSERYEGWRLGAFLGCCTASLVLFINGILLIYGLACGGNVDGLSVLVQGTSEAVLSIGNAYHISGRF